MSASADDGPTVGLMLDSDDDGLDFLRVVQTPDPDAHDDAAPEVVRRPVGRPRKHPLVDVGKWKMSRH